ncbi:MAG: prepilin peptidase [Chloroflexi bacterium]|nr:prepilin peptidase [Chloroflexota bacterium]
MSLLLTIAWTVALILVSWADWRYQVIPSLVIYPALALAVLTAPWHPQGQGGWPALAGGLVSGGILLGIWLPTRILRQPAVGFGDVELAAFCGLVLGWPSALLALLAGHLLAGLVALVLFLRYRRRTISLGPFLAAATLWWLWDGPRWIEFVQEWWHV